MAEPSTPDPAARSDQALPAHPDGLTTVIFDLGAVVLEWSPHLPFEQVLAADEVGEFMAKIDFYGWNRIHDAGQAFEVGERALIERFPESATAIRAYREHFPHALTGMVPGTGAVIAELQQAGVRLLALTNWSAETFPHARQRFGLLDRFEGIVVSGTELLAKPDPAIFELVCRRYDVDPAQAVFVDDSPANVTAAAGVGLTALPFSDATTLRAQLQDLGLLGDRVPVTEPLFHLTRRDVWAAGQQAGEWPWSSRDLTYEQEGYVHCSFREQVADVLAYLYPDVAAADLVVLEVDPHLLDVPVVVEDLGSGPKPHLYGPLPLAAVVAVHDLPLT